MLLYMVKSYTQYKTNRSYIVKSRYKPSATHLLTFVAEAVLYMFLIV